MNTDNQTSTAMRWTGRVLSTLLVLFMLFDGGAKVAKVQPVIDAMTKLGYPEGTVRPVGAAAVVGAVLYAIPQTAVLGAIILTAFLGGAAATHVRVGESNYFFAAGFGVIAWLGLYFRDARIRDLIPFRRLPT